jgi:hypothetical protein
MRELEPKEWFDYPKVKPEKSKPGSKKFYYCVIDSDGFGDNTAYKCWYSGGIWLCDAFRSSVRVKRFRSAPRNGKFSLKLR